MDDYSQYLYRLVKQVSVHKDEFSLIVSSYNELIDILKNNIAFCENFISYGSFSRLTLLSPSICPSTDVDIFCIYDYKKISTEQAKKFGGFANTCLNIIYNQLKNIENNDIKNVQYDLPCINLMYKGIKFQLLPAQPGSRGHYHIERPYTLWEHKNAKLLEFDNIVSAYGFAPTKEKPTSKLDFIDPYYLNRKINDVSNFTNDIRYYLIILLKYWKFVFQSDITSYYLELNVFEGLDKFKYFEGCKSILDFLLTFIQTCEVYNFKLLQTDKRFLEFYNRIKQVQRTQTINDQEATFIELVKCFPPPEFLVKYS